MKKTLTKKQTDNNKLKIIDDFCSHLEKGYSEYSFAECDFREIEKISLEEDEKNNNNYQVEKIKKSLRKSLFYWENIALEIYNDTTKKHFFPVWIFYMKNRFRFGEPVNKNTIDKKKLSNINLCLDNEVREIEK